MKARICPAQILYNAGGMHAQSYHFSQATHLFAQHAALPESHAGMTDFAIQHRIHSNPNAVPIDANVMPFVCLQVLKLSFSR